MRCFPVKLAVDSKEVVTSDCLVDSLKGFFEGRELESQ